MNKTCVPPEEKLWWLELADFLEELVEVDDEDAPKHGICDALEEHPEFVEVADQYFFLYCAWLSWDGYSGDPHYPVGNGRDVWCTKNDKCWTGHYGELRRDLCQHLADSIREMLP